MSELTHIGPDGRARMVDVSEKTVTARVAVACGMVHMSEETLALALSRDTKKGDPLAIAELAGIMAAKKTADLIPLCHPLPLTGLKVEIARHETETALAVTAQAKTSGQTGVEMEALTAVSAACLTIYDMVKAAEKSMEIGGIRLRLKDGGKSGRYEAPA